MLFDDIRMLPIEERSSLSSELLLLLEITTLKFFPEGETTNGSISELSTHLN